MNLKKMTAVGFAALFACSAMCACNASDSRQNSGKKIRIVCTAFAAYDWTKQILGDLTDRAEITYLLDNGSDLHNYQPSALDIANISSCDLFIYAGGESDTWAADAAKDAVNRNMRVVSMLDTIGSDAKTEEFKEGMEHEEEAHHEDDPAHDHTHDDAETELDEHVWLSLRHAKTICTAISDQLCVLDSENQQKYQANCAAYQAKLDELDRAFSALTDSAKQKTLVFGDRFPFRYFVDDYGLDYYAAFAGCSAETEASFQTIVFLAGKMDELQCGTIFTIENSDKKIARTVIDNTKEHNQTVAELNSIQSVSRQQIESGTTYLSMMQQNYDVLNAAIGSGAESKAG